MPERNARDAAVRVVVGVLVDPEVDLVVDLVEQDLVERVPAASAEDLVAGCLMLRPAAPACLIRSR